MIITRDKKITNSGYTILEMMVAIAVFLSVITVGIGTLVSAHFANQRSQDIHSILDGLSFMLEDMSRNMRTGYNFHCFESGESINAGDFDDPKSCEDGWAVSFEYATGDPESASDQWVYYLDSSGGKGRLRKSSEGISGFTDLSGAEVDITNFSVSVLGAEAPPGDRQQPLVILRLLGNINFKGEAIPFSLQTSASQRRTDI